MNFISLFSGIGGNRTLWKDVDVTAIEFDKNIAEVYSSLYPDDTVIIADAHQYLLDHSDEFDFIWSSPPCQSHSRMMKATRHKIRKYPDMALYQEVIYLKNFYSGLWVVENVKPYYEPLIHPTTILGRHYLWANFEILDFDTPSIKGFIRAGTVAESEKLKEWLGISYEGNIYYQGNHCPGQVLRNCVHPSLGKHIFESAT